MTLISVVLRVFNGAPYLAEAIDSVLGQTHTNLELIIVEDGSSDGSQDIIRQRAAEDERIRIIFVPHRGQGAAANTGVAAARGTYVAHLDQDDIAPPDRLARQLAWMELHGVEVCGGQVQTFGDVTDIYWYPETKPGILNEHFFRHGVMHPSAMLRTEISRSFPYVDGAMAEDYELWTRAAPACRIANMPEVLLRYRCHVRQTHVVHGRRYLDEVRRYRFGYFFARYPNRSLADYVALARVADQQAMTTVAELERAGEWLREWAQPPERQLRRAMRKRWDSVCERSAPLGAEVGGIRERVGHELQKLCESPDAR